MWEICSVQRRRTEYLKAFREEEIETNVYKFCLQNILYENVTGRKRLSVFPSVRLYAYCISRTSRRIWIKLAIANGQQKLSSHINPNLYRPIENLS